MNICNSLKQYFNKYLESLIYLTINYSFISNNVKLIVISITIQFLHSSYSPDRNPQILVVFLVRWSLKINEVEQVIVTNPMQCKDWGFVYNELVV